MDGGQKVSETQWKCFIPVERLGKTDGTYVTEVYAWDAAGNISTKTKNVSQYIDCTPPKIENAKVEQISTYQFRVSIDAHDDSGIRTVKFPTWTENNGQDDLDPDWVYGTGTDGSKSGDTYSYIVDICDHNYEKTNYITHIYVYDNYGNITQTNMSGKKYSISESFVPQNTVTYNGHIYELYDEILTWRDAKTKCEDKGGHLVTITSAEEQRAVERLLTNNGEHDVYWIGIKDNAGQFQWITGENAGYGNWADGEPNRAVLGEYGNQSVGQIKRELNYRWDDEFEMRMCPRGFICEYESADNKVPEYEISESWGDVTSVDIYEKGYQSPQDIPEGIWVAGIEDSDYTGKAITFSDIHVYWGKRLLVVGKDYSVSYKNNTKAYSVTSSNDSKAPVVVIKGLNNYNETRNVYFSINKRDISGTEFEAVPILLSYVNGKVQKVIPTLKWGSKSLKNNQKGTADYQAEFVDESQANAYMNPGTYQVKLVGTGNYTGERIVNIRITESIPMSKISASIKKGESTKYNAGNPVEPLYAVTNGKSPLVLDTDYTIAYSNNREVGTATVTISGIGKYIGTKKVTFKVTGENLAKATSDTIPNQIYSGKAIKPDVSLYYNGAEVDTDDYNISYSKNIAAGTATITYTGLNQFKGTKKSVNFRIGKYSLNNSDIEVEIAEDATYGKAGAKAQVSVSHGGSELKEGVDYKLSYKDNTSVQKVATVTISGIGNYSGSRSYSYNVLSNNMSLDTSNVKVIAADKVYQQKSNIYKTSITVMDGNKKLGSSDYDSKAIKYTYADATTVQQAYKNGKVTEYKNISRAAGSTVRETDIIPAGTRIQVEVFAKANGNYTGSAVGYYRITDYGLSKVAVSGKITKVYTGKAIALTKADFENLTITYKVDKNTTKALKLGDDFEIVSDSYSANTKKGTAKVNIKGKGIYGGTKTITFTIIAKPIK